MELEKMARQLRLLLLLTQNTSLTVDDVGEQLGMSRRSIYRYVDAFRSMGFVVEKAANVYRLDAKSPFFNKIVKGMQFTEDEACILCRGLNFVNDNTPEVNQLRTKFMRLYDVDTLVKHGLENRAAYNVNMLFYAMQKECVVALKDYRDSADSPLTNHIIEPYMFVNSHNDVRGYELSTGENKTFRLDGIDRVEQIDLLWSHKVEHTPFYTDIFGESGEALQHVTLLLTPHAGKVLLQTIPSALRFMTLADDGRQQLDVEVCGFDGVARFVLGLYDEVEIVKPAALKEFVMQKVARMR